MTRLAKFMKTRYFCTECYHTYMEIYDMSLHKTVGDTVPEYCIGCKLPTRVCVKVV